MTIRRSDGTDKCSKHHSTFVSRFYHQCAHTARTSKHLNMIAGKGSRGGPQAHASARARPRHHAAARLSRGYVRQQRVHGDVQKGRVRPGCNGVPRGNQVQQDLCGCVLEQPAASVLDVHRALLYHLSLRLHWLLMLSSSNNHAHILQRLLYITQCSAMYAWLSGYDAMHVAGACAPSADACSSS